MFQAINFNLNLISEAVPDDLNEEQKLKIGQTWHVSQKYRSEFCPETGVDLINKFKVLKSTFGKTLVSIYKTTLTLFLNP